jgi:hypothetical protein
MIKFRKGALSAMGEFKCKRPHYSTVNCELERKLVKIKLIFFSGMLLFVL